MGNSTKPEIFDNSKLIPREHVERCKPQIRDAMELLGGAYERNTIFQLVQIQTSVDKQIFDCAFEELLSDGFIEECVHGETSRFCLSGVNVFQQRSERSSAMKKQVKSVGVFQDDRKNESISENWKAFLQRNLDFFKNGWTREKFEKMHSFALQVARAHAVDVGLVYRRGHEAVDNRIPENAEAARGIQRDLRVGKKETPQKVEASAQEASKDSLAHKLLSHVKANGNVVDGWVEVLSHFKKEVKSSYLREAAKKLEREGKIETKHGSPYHLFCRVPSEKHLPSLTERQFQRLCIILLALRDPNSDLDREKWMEIDYSGLAKQYPGIVESEYDSEKEAYNASYTALFQFAHYLVEKGVLEKSERNQYRIAANFHGVLVYKGRMPVNGKRYMVSDISEVLIDTGLKKPRLRSSQESGYEKDPVEVERQISSTDPSTLTDHPVKESGAETRDEETFSTETASFPKSSFEEHQADRNDTPWYWRLFKGNGDKTATHIGSQIAPERFFVLDNQMSHLFQEKLEQRLQAVLEAKASGDLNRLHIALKNTLELTTLAMDVKKRVIAILDEAGEKVRRL